jgi:type I restriction enzyme S subunit
VAPRYLYWWFSSSTVQTLVRSFGQKTTNISNLNVERCLRLRLRLPSLDRQHQIAAILDKADALRAKRREALARLDELKRSVFLEMFGDPARNPKRWPVHCLGDLITEGPQNGLYKPASLYGHGTRILRIDGFYEGSIVDIASLKRVRLSKDESDRYALREGDIVINRVNSREYLGKSVLVPRLDEAIVFESNMMRFSVDSGVVAPTFLIQLLQTIFVRAQILRAAKDAVNQSSINQHDVRALRVIVPALSVQARYASQAASIQRQKDLLVRGSHGADALFVALQHRAFRGEL